MGRDQARSPRDPGPAAAAAAVRDLRLLAARRGRAPARRRGRPGRAALVRPAGGLPHRGARADEGAAGEERRDRAGRRQGRVRGEGTAGRPRGAAGRGVACYSDVRPRAARRDRQPGRRRRSCRPPRVVRHDGDDPYLVVAADKGTADLLRHRQRDLPGVRVLARRCLRLRRLGRLRPQGDGDHRTRGVGVGAPALPRARRSTCRTSDCHGRRHRGHVRRRLRQRDAALAAHPAGRRVRPPARLPRPRSGPGAQLRRAIAAVRPAPLVMGRLRPGAHLDRAAACSHGPRRRSRSRPRCRPRWTSTRWRWPPTS